MMITIFVIGFIGLYILGTHGVTIGRPLQRNTLMTYEKALIAINEDLDKARADNDLTKFYDIKIAKHVLLKEMGEEVAKEYIELFGK